MIKLYRTLMTAFVLAAVSSSASAAAIVGQLGLAQNLAGGVITTTPSGSLSQPNIVINTAGLNGATKNQIGFQGGFSTVAAGTAFSFSGNQINTGSLVGTVLTIAGAGTFTATTGSVAFADPDDGNLIKIILTGNYVTSGVTSGFDNNTALVTLTFSRTTANGAIDFSGSLLAPAPVIPEPSSIALAGIGMAAAGLFGLRKRIAK